MATLLEAAKAFIGRTKEEALAALGEGATFEPADEYQKLQGLSSLENPSVFPGTLYLKDRKVELVYLGDEATARISASSLEDELKGSPARRRSRAGKQASTYIHADDGVAYSAEGNEVHFIEVFQPCTLEEYEAQIYREPPDFIR
jgi:hypothetical protein